jgi:hypothetical protein
MMEHNIVDWRGVPEIHLPAWRKLFNDAVGSGLDIPYACPVCGNHTLHRYYHLAKLEPRELRGKRFQGMGGYWEWCSSCHAYEHMHGYVPEWWHEKPLDVDHSKLTPIPDVLDAARLK